MKTIMMLILVVAALFISGCGTEKQLTVNLNFQPMQCEETPWDRYYTEGNIKFFKAPTEKEIATTYYSSKNIELISFERSESGKITCQACDICPDDHYFAATAYAKDKEQLISDGWKIK